LYQPGGVSKITLRPGPGVDAVLIENANKVSLWRDKEVLEVKIRMGEDKGVSIGREKVVYVDNKELQKSFLA
jgi:hypothetical protein